MRVWRHAELLPRGARVSGWAGPHRASARERAEEGRVTTYDDRASLTDLTATAERVRGSVEGVIEGKPEVVRLSLTVLLAEGHLLIEDVPGVGKTTLAKALARSIDGSVRRIQFTPDLLPSDVTGVAVYDQA